MGSNSGAYKLVLVLHILSAIIGFGAVFLNGMYAAQAKARKGDEALAVAESNWLVSKIGEWFIYAVFVFGVLLVLLADSNTIEFGDAWISLSMGLFIVALGLSHGLLRPNMRRVLTAMRELAEGAPAGSTGPPPQLAVLEERGRIAGVTGTVLNILLVVILFLMVWRPG